MTVNTVFFGVMGLGLLLTSCAVRPAGAFIQEAAPRSPDYGDTATWASLPFTRDSADVVPDDALLDRQEEAPVDVFYVYPTTYVGKRGQRGWNGDVYDDRLNILTDKSAIRNQASVFNGVCKVYAPRYRQAHLRSFFTRRRKEDGMQALNLAYGDVKKAFQYYLEHYNEGRPLIIAGHSQGTWHARQLIKDYYDKGDEQVPELVAAYLIGIPVEKDDFSTLPPCETGSDIHCFCSWRTVHEKYKPGRLYPVGGEFAVINPISWIADTTEVSRQWHLGAVLTKFYEGLYPRLVDARIENGLLRVSRPRIPGVPLLLTRNYHVADYNFFYADIRGNVQTRVNAFLSTANTPSDD